MMAVFNDENEIAKRAEEEYRPIHHFCHPHQLKRCLYSFTTQPEKEMWEGIPLKCGKIEDFSLYCNECDVNLHASCANYPTRAIKHGCHPHNLLQLGKSIIHNISCNVCGEGCNDSCFSCKKCDFNVHPQCIPLPPSFKHKRHLHPLTLVSPFVEDDSGDYCCDMCETERNPDLQVYYCEECNYIVHINCVLSEVRHQQLKWYLSLQQRCFLILKERKRILAIKNLEMKGKMHHEMDMLEEVQSSFHPQHPLQIFLLVNTTTPISGACSEKIKHLVFSCLACDFNMHYSCATYQFREVKQDYRADHRLLHWGRAFWVMNLPDVMNVVKLARTLCGVALSVGFTFILTVVHSHPSSNINISIHLYFRL
ncbi:hypothetical protein F3Y22_tig00110584pilonHSYRG00062 [Hibiscus syriacus]|uniref:DC1 domain-containing protein n=1 Tax=Hibiscus syriacus TaxID=106335 RepID=A0A6A3A595_HIBSY|nr:hypothetical protein F3Y22_tig00110584pilonHSYRG00062 [Hibiscus syriacus]